MCHAPHIYDIQNKKNDVAVYTYALKDQGNKSIKFIQVMWFKILPKLTIDCNILYLFLMVYGT